MVKQEKVVPEPDGEMESCEIIWSDPDSEGHRHFMGLECESPEARDRAAVDMEDQELFVRVRSVVKK